MADTQYRLSYKTRGNSSPQGKPKVYFCCHPDDFGYLFESLSEEILAEQNCSVWYAHDVNTPRDADYLNDLSGMQLFVMPITSKLLYTENPAIDIEFPFAIEHHIPVLPLMQESDLENIFNQKCGNLQFLDKSLRDATAIPYEEKFKAFLASVLIGDELAQKIRSAFDAYIFLSYRKKDRRYAKELMRLIHKNEFCRDIAIWYDEYLTPGENFNDAIKQALEKSDLFVMTVTPNLVEEQNYIMTTEYPMAKEAGKTILPAEMVQTNRHALSENYDRLPTLTDAHDEAALSETLLSAIRALAIEENNHSPEHTFFIGLAYLSGIDMEVDHERAVALIGAAAEAGLPEAIDKLIGMYENGEGVARSYHTAAEWRERKIVCAEQAYQTIPDETLLHDLFWAIVECGDAYRFLGNDRLAREKYQLASNIVEASELASASQKLRRDLSVGYDRLGISCQITSDFKGAKAYYEKVMAITEALCSENRTEQARIDLAMIYRRMGIPGFAGANAVAYREKAIAIAEELVQETGSIRARELLLDAYRIHGVMLKISGKENLSAARDCYEKSLAIAEAIFCETGSLQARRDLAAGYGAIGGIHSTLGEFDAAQQYYGEELRLYQELTETTDAIQDYQSLAGAYTIVASSREKVGDTEAALAYYEKALSLRERLARETESLRHRDELIRACDSLGKFFQNTDDLRRARHYYERGITVREALCERSDDPKRHDDLAAAYCRMPSVHPEKTTAYLQKALAIYEELCRKFPEEMYYSNRLNSIRRQLES